LRELRLRLFIIGGGSRVKLLRQFLENHPALGHQSDLVRPVSLEPPPDLQLLDMSTNSTRRVGSDEFAFLAFAYGLSHLAAEIPPAYSPIEFNEPEHCERVVERLSHEDIYAK